MSTWVVGDIHGCYDDFMNILNNKEIKEEDTVILVGDIIDRGPKSYEMIKWAMNNITSDGKYQMVLGNHEDLLVKEYECAKDSEEDINPNNISLRSVCFTYEFETYMAPYGYFTLASIEPIIEWIKTLPLYKKLEVTTPTGEKQKYVIAHAWFGSNYSRKEILWFRDIHHYTYGEKDYDGEDGEILIHGHTPTVAIHKCIGKPLNEIYVKPHVINIDCGCVYTEKNGNLAAIRLEDQKVIYAREQKKIYNPYG